MPRGTRLPLLSGSMGLYEQAVRPLLFHGDAESVHTAALAAAAAAGATAIGRRGLQALWAPAPDVALVQHVAGVRFPHPIGLAAGFDKSARAVGALTCLGFGSVEVGSVSAHASTGNARPRLFRLPADEAIVVNYGVPNDGAAAVARRLRAGGPWRVPVGANLVETNTGGPTNADDVVGELLEAARTLAPWADWLTVNLNCPNTTAGVSPFDDSARLAELLRELDRIDDLPPVFLKFTAHRDEARADALLQAVDPHAGIAGFIFNLPPGTAYDLRDPSAAAGLPGTLCGPPTRQMMDDTLAFWSGRIDRRRHVLVGSGGIATADDAWRKLCLGASLLQLYTALVYRGPALLRELHEGLRRRLDEHGLQHISQAVGLARDEPATLTMESS